MRTSSGEKQRISVNFSGPRSCLIMRHPRWAGLALLALNVSRVGAACEDANAQCTGGCPWASDGNARAMWLVHARSFCTESGEVGSAATGGRNAPTEEPGACQRSPAAMPEACPLASDGAPRWSGRRSARSSSPRMASHVQTTTQCAEWAARGEWQIGASDAPRPPCRFCDAADGVANLKAGGEARDASIPPCVDHNPQAAGGGGECARNPVAMSVAVPQLWHLRR